jgi:hypothetical protein
LRIRVIQKPTDDCIDDSYPLIGFRIGEVYELEGLVAALFIAEGWGEPLMPTESAATASTARKRSTGKPKTLSRAAKFPLPYPPPVQRHSRNSGGTHSKNKRGRR